MSSLLLSCCGAVLQEPEVWQLLKDLEIAAKDHNTGSVPTKFLLYFDNQIEYTGVVCVNSGSRSM